VFRWRIINQNYGKHTGVVGLVTAAADADRIEVQRVVNDLGIGRDVELDRQASDVPDTDRWGRPLPTCGNCDKDKQ
jgi:hypothetical protein